MLTGDDAKELQSAKEVSQKKYKMSDFGHL